MKRSPSCRPIIVLTVVLAVALLVPSTAGAVTASVSGNTVVISGGAEANNVSVTESSAAPSPGQMVRVSDTAGVTAGPGCAEYHGIPTPTVQCGGASTTAVSASLGDGDDQFSTRGQAVFDQVRSVQVDGGAGIDTIDLNGEGTRGDVTGGDGNDIITLGGPDAQGNGSTSSADGGAGDDRINGNNGDDTIHGGDGDDTIDGNGSNDKVFGDAGNDNLKGGSGDDTIDGGTGTDTLSGDDNSAEAGNDTLDAVDGERDTVSCNFGADVANVDQYDVVEGTPGAGAGCDQINTTHVGGNDNSSGGAKVFLTASSPQKVLRRHRIATQVGCSAACYLGAVADIKIGSAKPFEADSNVYRLSAAGVKAVPIPLTSRQLRKIKSGLRHHKRVVATVYGELTDRTGNAALGETNGKKVRITG